MTAAVISTSEPERLYSGLSVLVSKAVDGESCAALLAFGGLRLFLDPDLGGAGAFGRSLRELRDTARELDGLRLYACAASVETAGTEPGGIEVMSTPRFLREVAAECLLFV